MKVVCSTCIPVTIHSILPLELRKNKTHSSFYTSRLTNSIQQSILICHKQKQPLEASKNSSIQLRATGSRFTAAYTCDAVVGVSVSAQMRIGRILSAEGIKANTTNRFHSFVNGGKLTFVLRRRRSSHRRKCGLFLTHTA